MHWESIFWTRNFQSAQQHYNRVLGSRKKKWRGWSLFKLGWCKYNLAQYGDSLGYWSKAFKYAENIGGKKGNQLKKEVINDIVLAYGSLGKLDQGLAFYRRNSPEDLKRVTRTLGYLADERGDVRKAGRAWKMVVRKYPDTDEALESQRALIASLFASSRYNELWKEIRFLIQKFGPGSQWQKGKTEEVIQDFDKNTIEMARYYPKAVHRAAEKKKSAKLYDQAELGYLLFLERFASSKYAPEIFEYLGDIFYYKKQFGKAGKMYLGVVEMGPKKALMYPAKKGRPKVS